MFALVGAWRYTVPRKRKREGIEMRYQPVKEENGDFVVVTVDGIQAFVYAAESCKLCYGRGFMGRQEGCSECLGEGEKFGGKCAKCNGTGEGEEGEKHLLPCPCLKHEFEGDKKEEYID